MRVLIIASVASMIGQFNMENIRILTELGFTVDVGCNFMEGNSCSAEAVEAIRDKLTRMGVATYNISFSRSAKSIGEHIKAYRSVKRLMKEGNYTFVHCHAPISGALARLAARATHTPAIYTAHGFHFHKGAGIGAWLFYYPLEAILSGITEVLITINSEDYTRAVKCFHMKRVYHVPGVGIDVNGISSHSSYRRMIREEAGIQDDEVLLMSVGELNPNKNHRVVLEAMRMLKNPRVKYCIAGQGALLDTLQGMTADFGIGKQVVFLGYRDDVPRLLAAADVFVLPSRREGLGVAGLEAMASSLPVIGSRVGGIADYVAEGKTGFLCNPADPAEFAHAIDVLCNDVNLREEFGANALEKAREFDKSIVNAQMREIYRTVIDGVVPDL